MDAPTGTGLADPVVGRLLDGRYRVGEQLARGGMATVYAATDVRLDRDVAVKVMHPIFAEDGDFVTRFQHEAKASARIASPFVVSVTDAGEDGGAVFLVMELVRGRTLRQLLRERGRLDPLEALDVLEPVALALAAAHRAGIVHRDVKPENVLLADDGAVKVADFGLARAVEASPLTAHAGLLLGTVAYLSPEQVASGGSSTRSDVYSAGVVLYELLTGLPPFEADSPLAVAYRHVHERVPAPSRSVTGVPAVLDDLVLAMTALEPDQRPTDGTALAAAVRRVRQQLAMGAAVGHDTRVVSRADAPTTALPYVAQQGRTDVPPQYPPQYPPPSGPTGRRHRRRGPFVAAAVLLAVCLAAAVAGWWLGSGRYVHVPRLLRDQPSAATQALTRAHLRERVAPGVYSDTVPAGEVVTSVPAAGSRAIRGATVAVALSLGPLMETVPSLADQPAAGAVSALHATDLAAAQHAVYSEAVPAGRVVATNPPAGRRLRHGSTVILEVSNGPAPVLVPNVTDEPAGVASATLSADGLVVSETQSYSTTVTTGLVISQSDPSGLTVAHGSAIGLVVSLGPQYVTVPDTAGEATSAATSQLQALGLVVHADRLPGTPGSSVVYQSPAGGRAKVGSTVTIYTF